MSQAQWYVAHTYSGYENKVKIDIEKTIENRGLQDQILEVCVPMQSVAEIKDGVERVVDKKIFPGYVLVHMHMNDETWYVVRNTRGVTGFVGPGSKPVPLSPAEMINLGLGKDGKETKMEQPSLKIDFGVGDLAVVVSGAWKGTVGAITAINEHKRTVSMNVEMLGRETRVELSLTEVRKKK